MSKTKVAILFGGKSSEYGVSLHSTASVLYNMPEEFEVDGRVYNKNEVIVHPSKKAICQMVMHVIPEMEEKEITYEELKAIASERGTGAFGSTNK